MSMIATVTREFTKGYAEVALWENGSPGKTRCVAENFEKAKRKDVVELEPAQPWEDRFARLAYLIVPVVFALGMWASRGQSLQNMLLSGGIMAVMAFVVAWLMNRPARLRNRLEYRVVRVLEAHKD
jgi:positive regulator of sigma E activity